MPRRGAAAPLLAMTCKNLPPVRTIPGHCRCTAGKRPYNRRRVAVFSMSLRTSAHTGVAIRFPRREAWQVGCCLGKFVALSRIRLRCCFLLCATAGEADCHVAPLLAMTCRNMQLPAVATAWCHGKFAGGCVFALSTAFRYTLPQGGRIVPSLYPVTHHCTSPSGKKERPREKWEKQQLFLGKITDNHHILRCLRNPSAISRERGQAFAGFFMGLD